MWVGVRPVIRVLHQPSNCQLKFVVLVVVQCQRKFDVQLCHFERRNEARNLYVAALQWLNPEDFSF
jgi:hypothetical protein